MGESRVLGRVHYSESPNATIMVSETPLPVGAYVSMRFEVPGEGHVTSLAIVSNSGYRPVYDVNYLQYIGGQRHDVELPKYSPITLYVVAEIPGEAGKPRPPKYPVPPNTIVEPASVELLENVYGYPEGVRIGSLAEVGVEIKVNPDGLAKHLLLTGATGSGKSNLVAILADRLSAEGAAILIFDVHGEYNIIPEDGNPGKIVGITAKINPLALGPGRLASIIIGDPRAHRQRALLKESVEKVNKEIMEHVNVNIPVDTAIHTIARKKLVTKKTGSEDIDALCEKLDPNACLAKIYGELLKTVIDQEARKDQDKAKRKEAVKERVEAFFEDAPITFIEEWDPTRLVSAGTIVVANVSTLTDEQKRLMLKLLVDRLFYKIQNGIINIPVVLVVEEAPLFLGVNVGHPVKESLQRFAREGRKYGGCLVVVSQRPRSLDVNVVSQLQNFAFLRMVQSTDIETVKNVADNLDDRLANIIPTLPDGMAIIMGGWIGRFPALVNIDLHRGKRVGATPRLMETWRRKLKEKTQRINFQYG